MTETEPEYKPIEESGPHDNPVQLDGNADGPVDLATNAADVAEEVPGATDGVKGEGSNDPAVGVPDSAEGATPGQLDGVEKTPDVDEIPMAQFNPNEIPDVKLLNEEWKKRVTWNPPRDSVACTYDTLNLPTFEEAKALTKPDVDDFSSLSGKTHCKTDALHEFTSTIRYKVKVMPPDPRTGKDYKILKMPKYPQFLKRFGVDSISEISLMDVNAQFSPKTLSSILEESESDRRIIKAAYYIGCRMRRQNRLISGKMNDGDIKVIKTLIPDCTVDTIIKVKNWVSNIVDAEKIESPTLAYGDEPRTDCTIGSGFGLDNVNITQEMVDRCVAGYKAVNESYNVLTDCLMGTPAATRAQREARERESFTKLFNHEADIPGNLIKKIMSIPMDNWDLLVERTRFTMKHIMASREVSIVVNLGEGATPFCCIDYRVIDGGGNTKFTASYANMDEMMRGRNSATLLRLIAARYRSVTV